MSVAVKVQEIVRMIVRGMVKTYGSPVSEDKAGSLARLGETSCCSLRAGERNQCECRAFTLATNFVASEATESRTRI